MGDAHSNYLTTGRQISYHYRGRHGIGSIRYVPMSNSGLGLGASIRAIHGHVVTRTRVVLGASQLVF